MTKRHAAIVEAVARIDRVPEAEVRRRVPADHRARGRWFAKAERRVAAWVRETERLQREAAARDRERWGRVGLEPPRDGDRYLTVRGANVDGWPA